MNAAVDKSYQVNKDNVARAQAAKKERESVKAKFVLVNDAIGPEDKGYFSQYPFDELEVGQGFFVANEDTNKDSLEYMRQEIFRARNYYSLAEHDADGHEVMEEVHIKSRNMINDKPEVNGDGSPIYSAQSVLRPKLIYSRHFSAYSVLSGFEYGKGEKAPADGVLVIREA